MVLCAGVSCWPNVNEPPLGCWLLLPPKLKVLGVVLNVFGGVNVVLGPVKGDADRALPPLFRLAIFLLAICAAVAALGFSSMAEESLPQLPYLSAPPCPSAPLLLILRLSTVFYLGFRMFSRDYDAGR